MLKNGPREVNLNDPYFLNLAVRQNNKELVRWLLEKGYNINAQNETQHPPVYLASLRGLTDMVEFLIENGAEVNQKSIVVVNYK